MALINSDTFVNIGLLGETRKKVVEEPPIREGFEEYTDIFYSTVSGKVRYDKWLDLIYSPRFLELALKSKEDVLMWLQNQLFLNRENILELFQIESQRRMEMYYVRLALNEIARGNYDLRDVVQPTILSGLMNKYPMLKDAIMHPSPTPRQYNITPKLHVPPTYIDNYFESSRKQVVESEPSEPMVERRKVGRPRTRKEEDVYVKTGKVGRGLGKKKFDEVETVRRALIHCVELTKLPKTLGYTKETIDKYILKNEFTFPQDYAKEENTYLNTVKGSISRHNGTWKDFVERHAICERALYKKLITTDPQFVRTYKIVPTPHSILYELELYVRDKDKVADLFGVSVDELNGWIRTYSLIKPIKMDNKIEKKIERTGGIISESQEEMLRDLQERWKKEQVERHGGRR